MHDKFAKSIHGVNQGSIAFPEIDVNIQQNDLKNPWITKQLCSYPGKSKNFMRSFSKAEQFKMKKKYKTKTHTK